MPKPYKFDVFVIYSSKDSSTVLEVANTLRARELKVWLDKWVVPPGVPWQQRLEKDLATIQSAAVLVGASGLSPWQAAETRVILNEFTVRPARAIPVLLPGASTKPTLPPFLRQFNWVDLRGGLTDEGLDLLQWGITGVFPGPQLPSAVNRAIQAEATQIAEAFEVAVVKSIETAEYAMKNPHMFREAETDPSKVNPSDKSKLVDIVCGEVIEAVLGQMAKSSGHILSEGYYYIPEERRATWVAGVNPRPERKRIIVADEADDTPAFITRLGGTVLLACYKVGLGWIAAAVGDFARRRVYSRVFGKPSLAIQLEYPDARRVLPIDRNEPVRIPIGVPLFIAPSTTKSLKDAAVNIYLGKPSRVLETAKRGKRLLSKPQIGSIHSHGGSLGPVLVADGSLDASVEFVKGFKRIDLIPGLFIAQGAGATVLELKDDLSDRAFSFRRDGQIEAIVEKKETSMLVEAARQRFVVAASWELANEIVSMLRQH